MATTKLKGKVAICDIKGVDGNPDITMVEVSLDDQVLTIVDSPDQNVRINEAIRVKARELIDLVAAEAHK